MEKYILTGGPGVGKTTLLDRLADKGFTSLPEVARQIIAEEQKKDNGILPWNDVALFEELVIERQLQQEKNAQHHGNAKIFLDRSLVDPLAFAEVSNTIVRSDICDLIEQASYARVFYLEQLPFYHQDKERKEDLDLAKKIHEQLYTVYDRLGFDIVTVPAVSIEKRVELILRETQPEKNREIEKKYRVGHDQVKKMLAQYATRHDEVDVEENKLYDLYGLLKEAGCIFRIRKNNDEYILTLKGPNQSSHFQNKREYNLSIPSAISKALQMILPQSVSYSKRRENYKTLGDARCTISLDYLPGFGEFVEIEAATENQVLLWERRLQLTPYAIKESYPQLVDDAQKTNSC